MRGKGGADTIFFINSHNRLTPQKAMLLSPVALPVSGGVLIEKIHFFQ